MRIDRMVAGAALAAALAPAQGPSTSFSRDVRPILERSCLTCHGASQQLSSFSLLSREAALRGGLHGAAIVPGKSGESALIGRLTGAVAPSMPLGGKLSAAEIAT
ncbi:MAG: hypothetical protein HY013_19405, partial [Candidatus Solibacter usitatus]|nr:hypothetical protein [Candidatus Solibacter usitatus]